MKSRKTAQPENLSKVIAISTRDKAATVLSFSLISKEKKHSEAKRRVYEAATNLNW